MQAVVELISFFLLRTQSPMLLDVQCLETVVPFILSVFFGCLRQGSKYGPCSLMLAKSGGPFSVGSHRVPCVCALTWLLGRHKSRTWAGPLGNSLSCQRKIPV